ncbi:unnamed protein product [Lepeophtheirus salmonis]|uniref:(salmon louse) hypothetical protein n=1 Tax=Lepeophtheirus salmonis TaxID=72036 RepID=A0A7R8CAN4_LEPSM|nr:unnamed protein product [Lepeophtheirus salmonis]CAF2751314.1 unnamed protein product [Lepeophtheirus salmonis]
MDTSALGSIYDVEGSTLVSERPPKIPKYLRLSSSLAHCSFRSPIAVGGGVRWLVSNLPSYCYCLWIIRTPYIYMSLYVKKNANFDSAKSGWVHSYSEENLNNWWTLCISPMSSNTKVTSPRRPQTVFSLFWSSQMDKIPKGRNGLIEASRLWRTMTDLEKEPFRATYRIERDNFVKPLLNEQDITERSIQVLKKKIRKYSKERKEIFAGRIFQKKLSSYNIFIAEAWSRSKRVPSQKWKDLTPAEVLEYEKKAKFENDKRDLEYENNPLTKEQEVQYIELSEKITKLKREVRAMEKELRSEDK